MDARLNLVSRERESPYESCGGCGNGVRIDLYGENAGEKLTNLQASF